MIAWIVQISLLVSGPTGSPKISRTASGELDIASCIPFLRQISFDRETRIPDDPALFARALLVQYDLFKNPILAAVALKEIGETKLAEWVKADIKEEDIDPKIPERIWDAFLKELHPDETNPDQLFQLHKASPKTFGEIKWSDFKLWQDLAREFTYEPRKAELAVGFLRVFMPLYAKYLNAWMNYKKPFFKDWGLSKGLRVVGGGIGGFVLAAAFDGGASLLVMTALGAANPVVDRLLARWKNRVINGRLARQGPQEFQKQLDSKNLLPTSVEHFERLMNRVVDLNKLEEMKPSVDIQSKTSIMEFGSFFNPLVLASANLLSELQQNTYENLKTEDLKKRFPEDKLRTLDQALSSTDIDGLISETTRLRQGIIESRKKIEILSNAFSVIQKKLSEFTEYLETIHQAGNFAREIAPEIADQVRYLNELFHTLEQVAQTMKLVDQSIAIDYRYLDALSRVVAQKQVENTLKNSTDRPDPTIGQALPTTPAVKDKPGNSLF